MSPADEAETDYHEVVVVGGGNAGISLAARLGRYGVKDVAIVEPRQHHLYQPMFSHVAGGTAEAYLARRPQESVMPKDSTWIRDQVTGILPGENSVVLASGQRIGYGQLVVCPGIQKNWDAVPGLRAAMDSPYGVSNYEFEYAAKAWRMLSGLESGTVVFTQPGGTVTCAGSSQKPMYLACDYWRQRGVLENIRVVMVVASPTIFGMPLIDDELNRKIAEYGIELHTESELAEVDPDRKTLRIAGPRGDEQVEYDVLHAVAPQSAPDWLKATALAVPGDHGGYVDVDPETLRHSRYPNVWSLGDAANTKNSKSGGALRKQALVLAKNLCSVLDGGSPTKKYNSYSECPFTVSRSTVVFSEFDDTYQPKPTIPFWKGLAKERRLTWLIDRHVLPWVYWNLILKGRA